MKPFYFGRSSRPLYGVLHPARGERRRPGVVVCPPFGQELLRAHRSLRELASRLADAGFPVLRFDYGGTGDSAGEADDVRLSALVEDTLLAADEMRETTGGRVVVAGLRLGGAVAALAAQRQPDIAAAVLWAPACDGSAYLGELRDAHAAWVREHACGARTSRDELLGFCYPPALVADLEALRLHRLEPPARALVVDGPGATRLWPGAEAVEHLATSRVPVWVHAEGMSRVLVPGDLLDGVVRWLERAAA